MTTVRAASSVTPNAASVPRRAAEARHREAAAQEVAHREVVAQEAALQEVLHRESRGVAAVAPAAMRTTSMHRATVVEVEGDDFFVTKLTKPSKQ